MSVDQSRIVDIVSRDKEGRFFLNIVDHLNWTNPELHLKLLEDKINTYLDFLRSGEFYEKYPDAKGCPIEICTMFRDAPTTDARRFLAKVSEIVETEGYTFSFKLLPPDRQ